MKLKVKHDAKKVSEIFEGVELDMAAVEELWRKCLSDPGEVFGEEKSRVVEYVAEAVETEDPVKLATISTIIAKGIEAMHTLTVMQAEAIDALKGMNPEDLPEEIRSEMERRGLMPKDESSIDGDDDEFEALKRKYS